MDLIQGCRKAGGGVRWLEVFYIFFGTFSWKTCVRGKERHYERMTINKQPSNEE